MAGLGEDVIKFLPDAVMDLPHSSGLDTEIYAPAIFVAPELPRLLLLVFYQMAILLLMSKCSNSLSHSLPT